MSKLSNMIEATQTGRIRPAGTGFMAIVTEDLSDPRMNASVHAIREYRVGVKLGVSGFVDDTNPKDVGFQLVKLKDMCKRQLIEYVFGEFRTLLREIERHLYAHDIDAARTALGHLENEMMS